jgi:uncharacterized protein YyaL (SSP411 family)
MASPHSTMLLAVEDYLFPPEIVAYICKGYQCSAPITSFDDLVASL